MRLTPLCFCRWDLGPAVMTDAQKLKFATSKDILMKDWRKERSDGKGLDTSRMTITLDLPPHLTTLVSANDKTNVEDFISAQDMMVQSDQLVHNLISVPAKDAALAQAGLDCLNAFCAGGQFGPLVMNPQETITWEAGIAAVTLLSQRFMSTYDVAKQRAIFAVKAKSCDALTRQAGMEPPVSKRAFEMLLAGWHLAPAVQANTAVSPLNVYSSFMGFSDQNRLKVMEKYKKAAVKDIKEDASKTKSEDSAWASQLKAMTAQLDKSLAEEVRLRDEIRGLKARQGSISPERSSPFADKRVCYTCNQRGHISRNCTNAMVQDMSTGAGLIVPPAPMGGH